MDNPKHDRHLVVLYDDGSLKCECGPQGESDGQRIGAAVALGAQNLHRSSCAGLIAFVAVGLPKLVAARVDTTGKWGGWQQAWARYATNALVREAFRDLAQKRDEKHAEALKLAHKAIVSCGRYRDGMSRSEFGEEVGFVPDSNIEVGATIALFSSDSWSVPLQRDWLESVGKAKPVIDGRFIVGVGEPGFVYAIDGSNEHGYTICEFAVVGDRLGKLAKAKAA
jgi:hypothetical protein